MAIRVQDIAGACRVRCVLLWTSRVVSMLHLVFPLLLLMLLCIVFILRLEVGQDWDCG